MTDQINAHELLAKPMDRQPTITEFHAVADLCREQAKQLKRLLEFGDCMGNYFYYLEHGLTITDFRNMYGIAPDMASIEKRFADIFKPPQVTTPTVDGTETQPHILPDADDEPKYAIDDDNKNAIDDSPKPRWPHEDKENAIYVGGNDRWDLWIHRDRKHRDITNAVATYAAWNPIGSNDVDVYINYKQCDDACRAWLAEHPIEFEAPHPSCDNCFRLTADLKAVTTERDRLQSLIAEFEACIKLIRERVLCCEGDGPEEKHKSLALSITKVVSERDEFKQTCETYRNDLVNAVNLYYEAEAKLEQQLADCQRELEISKKPSDLDCVRRVCDLMRHSGSYAIIYHRDGAYCVENFGHSSASPEQILAAIHPMAQPTAAEIVLDWIKQERHAFRSIPQSVEDAMRELAGGAK
jgi:hypothetical protein